MTDSDKEELGRNEDCPILKKLPAKLRSRLLPFQKEGVRFAINKNGRCLIADEMGLGKTLQAISVACYYKDDWPLLIIVPSSLKFCWIEELEKWLPDILPHQINLVQCGSDASGIADSPITIITYGLLRLPSSKVIREAIKARKFKIIICDESHYLKNYKTLSSKTVVPLVKAANRRLLLSGTPALSKPVELYPQIDAICPGGFGSFWQYTDKYCDARTLFFGKIKQRKVDGASNLEDLQRKLQNMVMIRREKSEVLKELPPKQRQRILFDLKHSNVKKDILERFSSLKEKIHKGDKKLEKILQGQDSVLDQQNDGPHPLGEDGMAPSEESPLHVFSEISKLYKLSGDAKIGPVRDYIEMLCENEQLKFLVFAYHIDMMDGIQQTLQDHKIKFVRIDGSTKGLDRQAYVTQFQSDPDTRVAILSILAAGVGLTFTEAKLVVFAELYWTPGVMVQCEDRAHRIGQTSSLPVHYLVAKDTMDEWVWSAVCKKTIVTSRALTGKSRKLDHSEGNKYQIDVLSNAEAWQTEEKDADISVSELIRTQRPSDQSSILEFFPSQSGQDTTITGRKRKHLATCVDSSTHLLKSSKNEEDDTGLNPDSKSFSNSVENVFHTKYDEKPKGKAAASFFKSGTKLSKLSEMIIIVSDDEDEFKPTSKKRKKRHDLKKNKKENKDAKNVQCNDSNFWTEAKREPSSFKNTDPDKQRVSKYKPLPTVQTVGDTMVRDCDVPMDKADNNSKSDIKKEGSKNSETNLLKKCEDSDCSIFNEKDVDGSECSLPNIEVNQKPEVNESAEYKLSISLTSANSKESLEEYSLLQNCNQEQSADNPSHLPHDPRMSVQQCPTNLSQPTGLEICRECNLTSPEFQGKKEITSQWSCSQCTFLNHLDLPQCEVCDTPKKKASRKKKRDEYKSPDVNINVNEADISTSHLSFSQNKKCLPKDDTEIASDHVSVEKKCIKKDYFTSLRETTPSRCHGKSDAAMFHPSETNIVEKSSSVTSNQPDSVLKTAQQETELQHSSIPTIEHKESLHVDIKISELEDSCNSPDLFEDGINCEKSEAVDKIASITVHKVLKFSCSVFTGRIFVYDEHEESLQANFHPIDIEVGSMGDLPDLLQHPHHQKLLQKFVREWSRGSKNTRFVFQGLGRLIIGTHVIFSSPLAAYNDVKTVVGNKQRHLTKQASLVSAQKKAKDIQGSVRVISKHSTTPVVLSSDGDDKESHSVCGIAQTVTEEGVPLCLQCQEPYKNPLLSSESISKPENAWQLSLCSFACMDKYWTLTKASYCRDQIYDIEHGICRLCQYDAHAFFTRLKITKDVKTKADLVNKSPFSVMSSKLKRKMVEQPQAGQFWHVDHITPVWQGGGMCDLDNMRTLCTPCHRKVTSKQAGQRANVKKLSVAASAGDITAFFQRL